MRPFFMPYKPQPKIQPVSFQNKPKLKDPRYSSVQWRKKRFFILQNNPVCNHCKRAPSTVADHITPVRLGGDFWNDTNLQALCASCHNSKSAKESKIK